MEKSEKVSSAVFNMRTVMAVSLVEQSEAHLVISLLLLLLLLLGGSRGSATSSRCSGGGSGGSRGGSGRCSSEKLGNSLLLQEAGEENGERGTHLNVGGVHGLGDVLGGGREAGVAQQERSVGARKGLSGHGCVRLCDLKQESDEQVPYKG